MAEPGRSSCLSLNPEPLNLKFPIVYPIIDTALCRERGIDPVALAEACLRGGARLLQLRGRKDESSAALVRAGGAHRRAPRTASARRSSSTIAPTSRVVAAADGVHVGQTDLPVAAVRAIVGPDAIVGLSTHDRDQIDAALAGEASYVAVGPVFLTATKDTGYTPRGLDLVRYAARRGKPDRRDRRHHAGAGRRRRRRGRLGARRDLATFL